MDANEREAARLADLYALDVLDTSAEPSFDRITRLAQQVLSAPIALISLVDTDRQWFKSEIGLGCAQTPRDIAFCSHAIARDDVMVVPDATRDPRFATNPLVLGAPNIRFYAGAPLRTLRGHNVGTLCVIDTAPRELGEAQARSLADLAGMAVSELELRRAGTIDALTGAANRGAFLREASRELSRSRRYGIPLSLVAIDLDRFKSINDRHGHAAGDTVLQVAAQELLRELRSADRFGRLGGEEFAALLPQTDQRGARAAAERLCQRLRMTAVPAKAGRLRVTASMGVATLRPEDADIADLLGRADRLLYRAKSAGRDRFVCQEELVLVEAGP